MNTAHANTIDLIDAPDLSADISSGRATWDERGNSIWEWQTAPGVYSRDISSQQLQALQAPDLRLQDGLYPNAVETMWSRKPKSKQSATRPTELVLPMRTARPSKNSGFEMFLRRMGLPA